MRSWVRRGAYDSPGFGSSRPGRQLSLAGYRRPNKSFKPNPLRGLVAPDKSGYHRLRKPPVAGRLNSGVRRGKSSQSQCRCICNMLGFGRSGLRQVFRCSPASAISHARPGIPRFTLPGFGHSRRRVVAEPVSAQRVRLRGPRLHRFLSAPGSPVFGGSGQLFRAVIAWGSLAPNNSFKPNPLRGFGTFLVSATTLFFS